MSIAARIVATWRDPRAVMRSHLAQGVREDRAIAVLMGAAALSFVASLPGLFRAAAADPSVPLEARLGAGLLASVFLMPLLAYALAGLSWLGMRIARQPVAGHAARMALFWAMLSAFPAVLCHRLIEALVPTGHPAATIAGVAAFGGFLYLWIIALDEARRQAAADALPRRSPTGT